MLPIGIGASLWVNALLLARHMNAESNVLTLPDVLSKKYGKIVELITSLICVVSFVFLLSSNLVGLGTITSYLWGISVRGGIWLAAFIVWAYTIGGMCSRFKQKRGQSCLLFVVCWMRVLLDAYLSTY